MGLRQKEKSEMTHQEIKASALSLFFEKGYKNTSVQDIVTASGYSIGSFYNHYKTKRDVLAEIWNEHAVAYISRGIEQLKQLDTPEALANYLIDNSNVFDRDEKTIRFAQAAQEDMILTGQAYEEVRQVSRKYIAEIASLLQKFCPGADEALLLSRASLLDAIQYSHSEVTRNKVGYIFDDEDVKRNILVLVNQWIEEEQKKMNAF